MPRATSRRIAAGILLSFAVLAVQACGGGGGGGGGGGSGGGGSGGGSAGSSASSSSASPISYTANTESVVASSTQSYIFPDYPSLTGLSNGNYAVAWQNQGTVGFRIVDGAGAPVTAETVLGNVSLYTAKPVVAPLANGGFVVVWVSQTLDSAATKTLNAQRYDSAGVAVGGTVTVASTDTTGVYYVRPLASGGYVVVWADTLFSLAPYRINAQFYNASGAAAGSAVVLKSLTTTVDSMNAVQTPYFDVSTLTGGGIVLVWDYPNTASSVAGWRDVYGQVFNASGTAQGAQVSLSDTANNASRPSVTGLADGRFVVGWESSKSSSGTAFASVIRTRIFSATGAAQGSEAIASAGGSGGVYLAGLTSGGFVGVWGGAPNLTVQVFDSTGAKSGATLQLSSVVANESLGGARAAAAGSNGGFAFAWHTAVMTFGNGASIKVRTYAPQSH